MEEWRDVKGYEGIYQVSSFGRVRNRHGVVLKPYEHKYFYVYLWKDGRKRNLTLHRLVATSFIQNKDNLPEVNHKDEDKSNNRVENLEWCTSRYNKDYGTIRERAIARNKTFSVLKCDKEGNVLCSYDSVKQAARDTGIHRVNIRAVCKNKYGHHTAGGYVWRYAE